ncbi:MAG: hypothetical protein Q9180_000168 [Flavoplaca navasiana]
MYIMIRFNNRYWVFNAHDYIHDIGDLLVGTIPSTADDYRIWLNDLCSRFFEWDAILQKFLCIAPEQLDTIEKDNTINENLDEAFDSLLVSVPTYSVRLERLKPTYTLDLDRKVFSFSNEAHFNLAHIPRVPNLRDTICDWHSPMYVDPNEVESLSLANVTLPDRQVSLEQIEYWNSWTTRQVIPKLMPQSLVSFKVRWELFDLFQQSQIQALSVSLLSWNEEDFAFRELAYFIICLAFGGDYLNIVSELRMKKRRDTDLHQVLCGDIPNADRELISSVGSGFHLEGKPMGTAPTTSKYWFESALICLVPRLEQAGVAPNAIVDADQYGRQERDSFNAVLISINALVLLRCFPDGSVDHSPIMPLMQVQGFCAMDATQRHGEEWLKRRAEDLDAHGYHHMLSQTDKESDGLEKAILKKDIPDIIKPDADCEGDDLPFYHSNGAQYEDGKPEESWTVQDTFSRLVNFFESTTRDTLKPVTETSGTTRDTLMPVTKTSLPNEILTMIISHVSDMKTYNACAKVSRIFRQICAEHPLIMDDLLFFDSPPRGWSHREEKRFDQDENQEETDGDEPFSLLHGCIGGGFIKGLSRVGPYMRMRMPYRAMSSSACEAKPDFYVVQQSTGEQVEVTFFAGNRRFQNSIFEILVGAERNRRSFVTHCPVAIMGLENLLIKQVGRRELDDDEDDDGSDDYQYGSTHISLLTDHPWDVIDRAQDVWKGDVEGLSRLWTRTFNVLMDRYWDKVATLEEHYSDRVWMLPPNTRQFFVTTIPMIHVDYERLVYLRIKRASRFVHVSWEAIILEARLGLDETIEFPDHLIDTPFDSDDEPEEKQAVGRVDPYVILVIGFDVRLFKWHRASGGENQGHDGGHLVELSPGRIYSLLRKEDRKPIEEVICWGLEWSKNAKRRDGGVYSSDSE